MGSNDMDDVFESEFNDITDEIEEVATDFYDEPGSEELDLAYRLMHTLKGNCYTVGYEAMGDLVHTFEDVLGELKNANQSPSAEIGDLLLDVNDELKNMYENSTGEVPQELVQSIESILEEEENEDSDGESKEKTQDNSSGATSSTSSSTSVEINEIPVSINKVDDLFRKSENLRAELLERDEKVLMQEAGKISRSLLDMRLIRPKSIVPKLKRLVRSTSKDLDEKEIDFNISGENNQASASVIEDLSKILPHLLKNSIDHGIENKSTREDKDKDPTGTVELSFEQVASSFIVKVSDDGAGLDAEEIAESAVQKGVVEENDLKGMTRYEKLKLVFKPGFSTTEEVSEVSGRGVGMDAVATTVREYGGRVEIDTDKDQGTTFELHFPVSFQWNEFLLVKLGSRKIGLPLRNIQKIHCIEDELKPQNGLIQTEQQGYPQVGFEGIDPRFGDPIERPVIILDLAMPVALAVDQLLGFCGTLILSPPSESRESYISGIGRDSSGKNFWGINLKEVSRNINSYMVGT